MKKLYSFLAGIAAIILVLWGIATHLDSKINSRDSQKLVIYNWGDYIDPELLTQSQKKQASKSSMRPLIPTKPCIPRLSRVERPMILLSQVNT